jgi:hypothetical protein
MASQIPNILLDSATNDIEIPQISLTQDEHFVVSPQKRRRNGVRGNSKRRQRQRTNHADNEIPDIGLTNDESTSLVNISDDLALEIPPMGMMDDVLPASYENTVEDNAGEPVTVSGDDYNQTGKLESYENGEDGGAFDSDTAYESYEQAALAGAADFYQIGRGVCVLRGWNKRTEEATVRATCPLQHADRQRRCTGFICHFISRPRTKTMRSSRVDVMIVPI